MCQQGMMSRMCQQEMMSRMCQQDDDVAHVSTGEVSQGSSNLCFKVNFLLEPQDFLFLVLGIL